MWWKRWTDEVTVNNCINFQTYPFSCLLFERLLFLLLFQSLSHLHNTCGLMDGGRREGGREERRKGGTEGECQVLCYTTIIKLHKLYLDEVGKVERWLLNASLPLEILPLEAPVARNRNRITSGLSGEQEEMERRPLQWKALKCKPCIRCPIATFWNICMLVAVNATKYVIITAS